MHDVADNAEDNNDAMDPNFSRILWLALLANFAMFAIEGTAGNFANSSSLQADAIDFLADGMTYGLTLYVAARSLLWRASAGLAKGVLMAILGFGVLVITGYRALNPVIPEATTMGVVAIIALVVNVWVALMLYRYRHGDSNIRSVWLCTRNDAINNIAVFVAAVLVATTATQWPDLAVGFGIAALEISAAWQVNTQALGELRSRNAV
jgi:Co/Zn/Cd efflux system component